jgi:hypothetical protein
VIFPVIFLVIDRGEDVLEASLHVLENFHMARHRRSAQVTEAGQRGVHPLVAGRLGRRQGGVLGGRGRRSRFAWFRRPRWPVDRH